MSAPTTTVSSAGVGAAVERARRLGRPVLFSTTARCGTIEPVDLFAAASGPRFYWERPGEGLSLVGTGAAWQSETGGGDRFDAADAAWRALVSEAIVEGPAEAGPRALGGFAFAPAGEDDPAGLWRGYPSARLTLPQHVWTRRGAYCWLTESALVGAGAVDSSQPQPAPRSSTGPPARVVRQRDLLPADEWQAIVGQATGPIGRGALQKVVLARAVQLTADRPFDLALALRRLRAGYPTCALFAFGDDESCFLGATPERLVRLDGDEVQVSCLAGTAPRGATPEEDRRLGLELLASSKNRQEHALVVQQLVDQLAAHVDQLTVPDRPELMVMPTLQHLSTPLRGRLTPRGSLLRMGGRLHPTPAVGGSPTEPALRFIRAHERLARGWYAGPVGWLNARGDGELVVALRSALVRGEEATLFAGCGIVAESDPASELTESCLKLRPMQLALGVDR